MADPLVRIQASTTETESLDVPAFSDNASAPIDAKLVVQCCLLLIAVLTVDYLAADIILPIVLAAVLNLLLRPAMRLFERAHIPGSVGAFFLLCALFGAIVGIVATFSGPAADWAQKLPSSVARLEERLSFLNDPINTLQGFLHKLEGVSGSTALPVGGALTETLFRGTQHFASGFFETLLVLFFMLISGDTFLRRTVEIAPNFRDKRRVIAVAQQIEENVSAYLLTITLMNAAVGVATAGVMWVCGVGDPVLWGGVAFLLNYVPIMGPLVGVVLFFFIGFLAIDGLWAASLPAALYFVIHLVEGETVTPMLLAKRFTLNPVLVIISLIFWFWMWGVPGAILSVPMLAIAKIICDDVKPLNAIGHFLEG
jgi:predicted PurR-regulated permease PerM